MRKFIKTIKDHKKNAKGSVIQKYLKGLIVAKKYEPYYIEMRLTNNLKYFEENNMELYKKCCTVIWYWYKKYRKKKEKKKRIKEEKQSKKP
tara:strand:+ start:446 stop:718 length:273 start_codon:yes stop_codon:yes gene_type:complete